jgi:hypothetical protein
MTEPIQTIQPTKRTLYLRSALWWQLIRFVVINVRMVIMIFKSH